MPFSFINLRISIRTGVPASITMAQALLESHMGKSDLALNSNNHFGIKCKENWTGSTYYHKDDDTDHSGNLIPSCFRAYQNVMDSYVDHSNFIKYRGYYAHLMILDKNDYKSWAWGLQKAGYATDKGYASKLINYIEIYDLNSLNDLSDPRDILR